MSNVAGALLLSTGAALACALVAGFFGSLHPAFDSLAHFRVHLAVALSIVAMFALTVRRLRLPAALGAGIAGFAIVSVTGLPGFGPVEASVEPSAERTAVYRLMQINLRYDNAEPGKVLSLIGRVRPDVLTLNEVSGLWRDKLALLSGAYPHSTICGTSGHAGGVAILSLRPFAEGSEARCLAGGSFATATIDFGGRHVDVGALHLHWPWPMDQAAHVESLAPLLGSLAETAILAGDLNATPWSAASSRIAEAASATPAGPSRPTWLYRRLPDVLRFAGLPIDRIFTKGDVIVRSVDTLDPAGSDHLPVLMEFSLTPGELPGPDRKTATAFLFQGG